MNGDLIPTEPGAAMSSLALGRPPELVLAEAKKAAMALKTVIDAKPNPVKMNGETYLEAEDWATVSAFFGCTAKVRETRVVTFGTVTGFEAFADVIVMATGQVIGAAESMCLNDEARWSSRPKYEWMAEADAPKGATIAFRDARNQRVKVHVGDEPVPLFQLRSMAQTRACAKALRTVFAWVVVLAGYKPTVAEELVGNEGDGGDERRHVRTAHKSPQRKAGSVNDPDQTITPGALTIVIQTRTRKGLTEQELLDYVAREYGVERLEDLPMAKTNDVVKWIGDQPAPAADGAAQ